MIVEVKQRIRFLVQSGLRKDEFILILSNLLFADFVDDSMAELMRLSWNFWRKYYNETS